MFREALVEAKQNLQKARGTVLTGYSHNEDLALTAKEIAGLAAALLDDMGVTESSAPRSRTARK